MVPLISSVTISFDPAGDDKRVAVTHARRPYVPGAPDPIAATPRR
jgi:hypothetical protein